MHNIFSNFVCSRENCDYFCKYCFSTLTTVVHTLFFLILLEIMSFPPFYPHYPQDYIIFLWITSLVNQNICFVHCYKIDFFHFFLQFSLDIYRKVSTKKTVKKFICASKKCVLLILYFFHEVSLANWRKCVIIFIDYMTEIVPDIC